MTDIHISKTDLSDFHKDAYGFRPRGHYQEWWTEEEVNAEYDRLSDICNENIESEAIQQKAALADFEKLIQETINQGAGDRLTAIRWLIQGEELDIKFGQDVDHFFWIQGVSWKAIDRFKLEISALDVI